MREKHPLRDRAVSLLKRGVVTPADLIAYGMKPNTVWSWRHRAGIKSESARKRHVRSLLLRRLPGVPDE